MSKTKNIIVLLTASLLLATPALARIYDSRYDMDNDGWIEFGADECREMYDAGAPVEPVECGDGVCVGCADAEGNPMWCIGPCKVTGWNYAIYLATQNSMDEYKAKIDWMFDELLDWNDCYKLCKDKIPNNIFDECFEKYGDRLARYIRNGKCTGESMP